MLREPDAPDSMGEIAVNRACLRPAVSKPVLAAAILSGAVASADVASADVASGAERLAGAGIFLGVPVEVHEGERDTRLPRSSADRVRSPVV